MRVIFIPKRLRIAVACLSLAVPLAAFETVIAARAPWWRLPKQNIAFWSSLVALTVATLSFGILWGRITAYRALVVLAVGWCAASAWMAMRMGNPSLGFLTLLLALYLGATIGWIRREISRSFFDPGLRWFHGRPRPVPGLGCRTTVDGQELEFRVSRIDKEGVFVYRDGGFGMLDLKAGQASDLKLSFRDRVVTCRGLPIRSLDRGSAAGFQFGAMSPDSRKELGDFVESLRGEGYV